MFFVSEIEVVTLSLCVVEGVEIPAGDFSVDDRQEFVLNLFGFAAVINFRFSTEFLSTYTWLEEQVEYKKHLDDDCL